MENSVYNSPGRHCHVHVEGDRHYWSFMVSCIKKEGTKVNENREQERKREQTVKMYMGYSYYAVCGPMG